MPLPQLFDTGSEHFQSRSKRGDSRPSSSRSAPPSLRSGFTAAALSILPGLARRRSSSAESAESSETRGTLMLHDEPPRRTWPRSTGVQYARHSAGSQSTSITGRECSSQ